ncbi:MAG: serine hydrolase [Bryobacterales bacterium]|nr:serine hydrolase [Bryobacterales bacterium]
MTLRTLLLAMAGAAGLLGQQIPMTGKEVPQLLPYETAIRRVMEKWAVPGAAVAILDGSRLIYARGFGFADREAGTPVRPDSRFRVASISKTVTGVTTLRLVQEGRIDLSRPFMTYLPDLAPTSTPPPDPRMAQVTVRQLLQHTAGFDREIENDHVLYYNTASRLFDNAPVTIDLMSRYIMSQRLDFAPGTKYAYGNSAYQLLGRIIEKVTGKKYLDAVNERTLHPAGAFNVDIGGNLLSQRLPDEVRYYDYPGAPLSTTAGAPGVTLPAARPYNWRVDFSDSYGGLVGSAIDVARFLLAIEGRRGTALLTPATIATMTARPTPAVHPATGPYVGLTWRLTPVSGGLNWWHSGGASGTRNLMLRRQDGKSWVILTNTRPRDEDAIITDLFDAMLAAQQQVREWPTHDLFADFAGFPLATSAETLSFQHSFGSAAPEAQRLQVTARGGVANVTLDPPGEAWLKADRLSGVTPLGIAVSVDPVGLAPGTYSSSLRVASPNASNGPRLVRVVLTVSPAPAPTALRNTASQLVVTAAAAGSRLTIEGDDIAVEPALGAGVPEPGPLGGVSVQLADSASKEAPLAIAAVTPTRVDVVIPADAPAGKALVRVLTHRGRLVEGEVEIAAASPGLFSANRDGKGAALAMVLRTVEDGSTASQPAFVCGDGGGSCVPAEIDLGAETDKVQLRLAATGIRAFGDPAALAVRIGEELVEVAAVQPDESEAGVDMVTVNLPRSLAGRGELDVTLTAAEIPSNAVKIVVK